MRRGVAIVARMTTDEKVGLVRGCFPLIMKGRSPGMTAHAGYVPGIARLGIPDLQESDASLGVANALRGPVDDATALPSVSLSSVSNWDQWRDVARAPLYWTWKPSPADILFAAAALFLGVAFSQAGMQSFVDFNF